MKEKDENSNKLSLIMLVIIVSLCFLGEFLVIFSTAQRVTLWERDFRLEYSSDREESDQDGATFYQFKLSENRADQVLYCQGSFQFASIWINGVFIGEYPGKRTIKENLGLWHAKIPLPEGEVNIYIEVMSPYEKYKEEKLKAYIGSEQDIDTYLLSESFYRLSFAILGAVIGLFFIIISIAGKISYNDDLALMFFGIFFIIYSIFALFHERNPNYFIYALFTPRAAGNISFILSYMMLIPNAMIFVIKSIYFKKESIIIAIIVFLFVITACGAQALGIKMLPEFLSARQIIVMSYSAFFSVSTLIEYRRGNRFLIWLFLWISVTMTAYVVDVFHLLKQIGLPDILISYIVIFVLAILVCIKSIAEYIKRIVQEKTELHNIALRNQVVLERYENARTYMEQTKQVRHEIRNNFLMLKIILDQECLEKAKQYIQEIVQDEKNYDSILYSENYLVDGIVGSAAARAQKNDIRFSYDIVLPSEIHFSEKKLNSFLGNMLDNAIESCCRKASGEDRFIQLSMAIKDTYLYIQCSNSKGNEVVRKSGQFISSKLDRNNHGYGLKIMDQIVAQSNGILEIDDQEGVFALKALLQLTDAENK